MQRAWVALLIGSVGCGFSSSNSGKDAGTGVDAPPPDAPVKTSWSLTDTSDGTAWAASTLHAIGGPLEIASNTVIDTDAQANCIVVEVDVTTSEVTRAEVCAVFASSITIKAGATLTSHGKLPLALFAPTIDVEGAIDVASHLGGGTGAGANIAGCNPSAAATGGGGGAGGAWTISGGIGGDQGGSAGTGGRFEHAIAATLLRGGCEGRRGGDGSPSGGDDTAGGSGGGALWISTNSSINDGPVSGGTLTLGPTSVINASGAGGIGGSVGGHGGSGGGSGGLIVLQSKTITQDGGAKIFANGGHGGGGSSTTTAGLDGTDPIAPTSTGGGGTGGDDGGNGGNGYPASGNNLAGIAGSTTSGGGGGGGGGGVIRADTTSLLGNNSFSPMPKPAVH